MREPDDTSPDDSRCPTCGADRSSLLIAGFVEITCPACLYTVTRVTKVA